MKDQLISFETAKLAKEKGFNIELLKCFNFHGSIIKFGKTKDYYITKDIYYSNEDLPYKENTPHYPETFVCTAPTQSLLQKWLRDIHTIHIKIDDFIDDKTNIEWDYEIVIIGTDLDEKGNYVPLISYDINDSIERKFKTYEEALEIGLQEALKLIK